MIRHAQTVPAASLRAPMRGQMICLGPRHLGHLPAHPLSHPFS
ncbi:hypothetical protein ACTTAI_19410 [Rhodobacter capsulatus]